MSRILSRFRRSPSRSSAHSDDDDDSRRRSSVVTTSSSVFRPSSEEDYPEATASHRSPHLGEAGSSFVENLPGGRSPHKSQKGAVLTPDQSKNRPPPLQVPGSGSKPALGTPKLVLTEEGSSSPRSFNSSPSGGARGQGLGLGLNTSVSFTSGEEDDLQTPTVHTSFASPKMTAAGANGAPAESRLRSETLGSQLETKRPRSGSIVSRLTGKQPSPIISPASLAPSDPRHTVGTKSKKGKKSKKERTRSGSSGVSGTASIAAALAKSGLHIASPADTDLVSSAQSTASTKRSSTNRSPWLVRGKDGGAVDDENYIRGEGDDEQSRLDVYDVEDEEDDGETDSDLDDHLPVTGFAVASNRRQADFHALFSTVDEGDYLIEDYGCALSKDILVQGRLYVSENHLCFHANIFGWVTNVVVPFTDIKTIEKKMTALVIPNAIGVSTGTSKYTFASFISRDTTFDVMMNIWRLCNPNAVMSTVSFSAQNGSRPASIHEAATGSVAPAGGGTGHTKTDCNCGKAGRHYSEIALTATFHSTPEKVYNLMFNSEWFKTFMSDNQKLKDIEMSDWRPADDSENLMRTISYIKPLNGSIGPKQTKCHITDEHQHRDFDQYISMLTTTRTPDVPSGGVFSVKTRTCLTWAGSNSTKVVVTTTVEWTGKSWVKGIIEKSAIDGQKQYHEDLETAMKAYIKEHATEFAGAEGTDPEAEAEDELDATGTKPSEAAAYAAQQRKERQDMGFWSMQGGFDSVASGLKSIFTGLKDVCVSAAELATDSPKEALLGVIIAILVISNVYTYYAYKTPLENIEMRRAKRLGRSADFGEHDVEEAMRLLLRERTRSTPWEEARELERTLDNVESRVARLRTALRTNEHHESRTADDLD